MATPTPTATDGAPPTDAPSPVSSGLAGLDTLLRGGFTPGRAYQVRGRPGTGKTILGWHFLTAAGEEPALLITFDEPEGQLRADASTLGFETESARILDLSPTSSEFADQEAYDLFLSADGEGDPLPKTITETVEEVRPARIVVDSMSHLRHLSTDASQHRKKTLAFLRYLKERDATTLLLSEGRPEGPTDNLHFLSDGIVELTRGEDGRSIQVLKQRGRGFAEGTHSVSIGPEGMSVHPRLQPAEERPDFHGELLSSGVPEIDQLLGGGIDRGTVTMISGPSGAGKTTLGLQLMKEAAGRGERSVVLNFEEEEETMIRRSEQVNIPVKQMIEQGTLALRQFRPWSFDPGRFAEHLRREVETKETSLVMIDSVNSFWKCGDQGRLEGQMHRACKYLVGEGVTVVLINEVGDITGTFRATDAGISHLADNLVFLRYLEMRGELRKAIGVLKKRTGSFEKTLREFQITEHGIKVGEPLTQLRGVLTGTPEWIGDTGQQVGERSEAH